MRVSELMTRTLVTLPMEASVATGLSVMEQHDVHHILIVADNRLAGVACVCDLRDQPRADSLGSCITRPPEVLTPDQSLEEAVKVFVQRELSCLPVCEQEQLVGVLTRSDLRRSEDATAHLPADFACTFCGSTRHVRPLRGDEALAACLECNDRSAAAKSGLYEEGTKD